MKILITGAAGFIGFHTTKKFVELGHEVVGIDNLNSYYDVNLKKSRLEQIKSKSFTFIECDFANNAMLEQIFAEHNFQKVIHLGAQAGVRHSLSHPQDYVQSNLVGFVNILEACRHAKIGHLVYASSSSVYGMNEKIPFSESDNVDHPISLYAATKKSNELIAHTYSHLYDLPTTGLRFFTVYGPWGRPDMAYFLFTKAILENKEINIYNNGLMERDFTYIDDVVNGIIKISDLPPERHPLEASDSQLSNDLVAPYRIFNIGNNKPEQLMHFIETIEECLGKKAKKKYLPMQPGDVIKTFADIDNLYDAVAYKPTTSIAIGIKSFVDWYKIYYKK
jgi:UDP-glucuronate 4-epimerase